jgi:hypothetical protein
LLLHKCFVSLQHAGQFDLGKNEVVGLARSRVSEEFTAVLGAAARTA